MGKIQINRRNNFTMVSNHVLRNENLSLKAKGLYAYMWSLPDSWDYSVAGLTKVLKEGKSAINEALKELEHEGYLVRTNGDLYSLRFKDQDQLEEISTMMGIFLSGVIGSPLVLDGEPLNEDF